MQGHADSVALCSLDRAVLDEKRPHNPVGSIIVRSTIHNQKKIRNIPGKQVASIRTSPSTRTERSQPLSHLKGGQDNVRKCVGLSGKKFQIILNKTATDRRIFLPFQLPQKVQNTLQCTFWCMTGCTGLP